MAKAEIDKLLATLYHPGLKSIDLSLGRMERFLAAAGNPELEIPPIIHVAGTNGKGSLVAYVKAILNAAGCRTHVYTSPHLVKFNERIVIADTEISDDELLPLLEECAELAKQHPITFFEITTAAAFIAFSRKDADYTILEVGMGGRFDATNVIQNPLVTAITPVSIDHAEFLGDTVAKIAFEKAGIIKPLIPCVVGKQEPAALEVIEKRADSLLAPLFRYGHEWWVDDKTYVEKEGFSLPIPTPSLSGNHQYYNAATAIACVRTVIGNISNNAISTGIQSTVWRARMQQLTSGRYADLLPDGFTLWLDGGHNPAAGRIIAENITNDTVVIFGMLNNKDAAGFLKPIAARSSHLIAIEIPNEPNCYKKEQLAAIATNCGFESATADSIEQAVKMALDTGLSNIIICGSLYLAGEVLKEVAF